jgi:predicted DNA-binding transcriptional regulator AlpA
MGAKKSESAEHDALIPDHSVAAELGCSVMSLWRRTRDPGDAFPPPVKIRNRNYRSRRLLEAYKMRKLHEAMRVHRARMARPGRPR